MVHYSRNQSAAGVGKDLGLEVGLLAECLGVVLT